MAVSNFLHALNSAGQPGWVEAGTCACPAANEQVGQVGQELRGADGYAQA